MVLCCDGLSRTWGTVANLGSLVEPVGLRRLLQSIGPLQLLLLLMGQLLQTLERPKAKAPQAKAG